VDDQIDSVIEKCSGEREKEASRRGRQQQQRPKDNLRRDVRSIREIPVKHVFGQLSGTKSEREREKKKA
jgi:hypothetical protein